MKLPGMETRDGGRAKPPEQGRGEGRGEGGGGGEGRGEGGGGVRVRVGVRVGVGVRVRASLFPTCMEQKPRRKDCATRGRARRAARGATGITVRAASSDETLGGEGTGDG